jgi:hypothetical protein
LIRWIARLQKKPHHHNKIMLLGTDLLSLSWAMALHRPEKMMF